jgi:hypothetical protein
VIPTVGTGFPWPATYNITPTMEQAEETGCQSTSNRLLDRVNSLSVCCQWLAGRDGFRRILLDDEFNKINDLAILKSG